MFPPFLFADAPGETDPASLEVAASNNATAAAEASSAQAVAEPPAPEPAVQTPAEQWEDIRDTAKAAGLDLSHIADSSQAARYLIDLARQNDAYSKWGQQLAPHYEEIQKYLAQRGQPAQQPAAAQPKNYFGIPEFNQNWLNFLEKDAAGNIVPKVGAPPDIMSKVTAYQEAKRSFDDRFYREPEKVLGPLIMDIVQPLLQQHIQQNLGQFQDQAAAKSFVDTNSDWLHQKDAQGNLLVDPLRGVPVLSAEGTRFLQHVQAAEQLGIKGVQQQQSYALDKLKLDILLQKEAQAQNVQNGTKLKDDFLTKNNRRPNRGGSVAPATNPNKPNVEQNSNLSLAERLRNNLKQAGVSDESIAAELG